MKPPASSPQPQLQLTSAIINAPRPVTKPQPQRTRRPESPGFLFLSRIATAPGSCLRSLYCDHLNSHLIHIHQKPWITVRKPGAVYVSPSTDDPATESC